MLRLRGEQVESLWDEVLPVSVRELPADLAALDVLLGDEALLEPVAALWRRAWPEAVGQGRPTIAMTTYMRLMVVRQRQGWGYETLVREVSDSLHLRRFCLIGLDRSVPDESTVRKLTRRLGEDTVAEITRVLICKATRETRFRARAVRVDSTVVEADVRYPSDGVLALQGTQALAREGAKLRAQVPGATGRVRDRSRSVGRRVRAISRTLGRRTGEAKAEVLRLNAEAGGADRPLGGRGQTAGGRDAPPRSWPWRAGEAARRSAAGGAGRALPARRRSDRPTRSRPADFGSTGVAV